MVKNSLLNPEDLIQIKRRIQSLNENSERKWGRMNVGQMLRHCDLVLKVGLGQIILPKTNFFLKAIGTVTKNEMRIFNNGIPKNMPTFKVVKVSENCNFEKSQSELLAIVDDFIAKAEKNNLVSQHDFSVK